MKLFFNGKQYDDIYLIVANNVKMYRKQKNISVREFAEKCSFSYEYIRRIESTKGDKTFSIQTVYIFSIVLDVPIDFLFKNNNLL